MELLLSVCLGIALSAACGLRVFVPLLAVSIANLSGHLQLAAGFGWMGSWPALVVFGVATALEIAAFYLPFLDNLLDSIAIPTAAVAGAVLTAACVTEVSPLLQWTLAAVVGGGMATTTQLATTKLRLAASATTAGLGNPLVATAELGGAAGLSILGLLSPILAAVGALALLAAVLWLAAKLVRQVARLAARMSASSAKPTN